MDNKKTMRITLKALDGRILHMDADKHTSFWREDTTTKPTVIIDSGLYASGYMYNVVYEDFLYSFDMSDKDIVIAKMLDIDELPFDKHVTITRN